MPPVARKGDVSSHGGTIITGSETVLVDGLPAARLGDLHACPINGHGVTPLISTCTNLIDGRPIVRVGDSAGCGATIVMGAPDVTAD